ncbi:MAG: M24 family metallopeptidase [Dehalococcoidia bacterium]|nr:M24 family metallopeptidase [Dehalococcoidia bacterium]
MQTDAARIGLMRAFLAAQGYDAIIVRSPSAVLMLSGYWPGSADAFCLFRQTGVVVLAVPEDDSEAAAVGWADEIVTFPSSASSPVTPVTERALPVFRRLLAGVDREAKLGFEGGPGSLVAFGETTFPDRASSEMLRVAAPRATWQNCADLLAAAMMWKSPRELDHVRRAAQLVDVGLAAALDAVRPGARECDIVAAAVAAVIAEGPSVSGGEVCVGAARALAGNRSALACGWTARSTTRPIEEGAPVVVDVLAGVDGFWSFATRTFFAGPPDGSVEEAYALAVKARDAALRSIDLGSLGSDVDAAAEAEWSGSAYARDLRRTTGHEVGFHGVNPLARPVIAPYSIDSLRAGQTVIVGAGRARPNAWGVAIADTVALTRAGVETLTTCAFERRRQQASA